jgi:hypothetical protein
MPRLGFPHNFGSFEGRYNAELLAETTIVWRGKTLKDRFITATAAKLYIHRHLIAPAQLMLERRDALEEWQVDQPSRAIH